MFDTFGNFDSAEEINTAADGLLNEGDRENIFVLAKENGIPKEYALAFAEGEIPVLCDELAAATGKIDIECTDLNPKELMLDWVEYIKGQCFENAEMAAAVRRKDKNLKGCIADLLMYSFKNQIPVDKEIIKAAGVSANKVTFGVPGMGTAKKIIRKYYLGGDVK